MFFIPLFFVLFIFLSSFDHSFRLIPFLSLVFSFLLSPLIFLLFFLTTYSISLSSVSYLYTSFFSHYIHFLFLNFTAIHLFLFFDFSLSRRFNSFFYIQVFLFQFLFFFFFHRSSVLRLTPISRFQAFLYLMFNQA